MYSAISAEVPIGDVGKFNATLFRHCVNTEKVFLYFFIVHSLIPSIILPPLLLPLLFLLSFFFLNLFQLVVCGQALSHCVNFTVRDIANRLIENGDSPSIIYLLTDGNSFFSFFLLSLILQFSFDIL